MPRKRKNPKNEVVKEPEDPINHIESVDDLISLLPIPPAESFRTNDNKENFENYESTYFGSSEFWSNEKEDLDQKIEKMECENEELKVEREEFVKKIDNLKTNLKISSQEKVETGQKLKEMECQNKKLNFGKRELVEKIEKLKSKMKISDQKIMEGVNEKEELKCKIDEMSIENNECMINFQFLKSLHTALQKENRRCEDTISALQKQLEWSRIEKDKFTKKQKDELEHFKTNLQKKPKPFFRWLLTGIWNGFSNLCGRFRDHFKRRNIFWKLFYITLIFISIMMFLVKDTDITRATCPYCQEDLYVYNFKPGIVVSYS